jgi:F-type H+-transporting ATPase subunit b
MFSGATVLVTGVGDPTDRWTDIDDSLDLAMSGRMVLAEALSLAELTSRARPTGSRPSARKLGPLTGVREKPMAKPGSDEGNRWTRSAVVAGAAGTGLGVSILFALTGLASPLGANVLEIVVGVSCFGLLYLLLSRAVFPRLEQIYAERADRIDGGFARAEETRAYASRLKAVYEEQLAEARAQAARIRDAARADGAAIRAELRGEAEAEVARALDRAAQEIARQRTAAAKTLRRDLGALATATAERVLGSALPPASRTVVEQYLATLDEPQDTVAN